MCQETARDARVNPGCSGPPMDSAQRFHERAWALSAPAEKQRTCMAWCGAARHSGSPASEPSSAFESVNEQGDGRGTPDLARRRTATPAESQSDKL
jgi:hypothetical protein